MTHLASPREDTRTGAFARLWAMLSQIFLLMTNPARAAEAQAGMAELEMDAARALLARALGLDPALAGFSIDDFEIASLWNDRGAFDPDFRLKSHVLAARHTERHTFLLQLRRIRLARLYTARAATFRGLRGRLRRKPGVSRIHRHRTALRACARIAERAAPRDLIPP